MSYQLAIHFLCPASASSQAPSCFPNHLMRNDNIRVSRCSIGLPTYAMNEIERMQKCSYNRYVFSLSNIQSCTLWEGFPMLRRDISLSNSFHWVDSRMVSNTDTYEHSGQSLGAAILFSECTRALFLITWSFLLEHVLCRLMLAMHYQQMFLNTCPSLKGVLKQREIQLSSVSQGTRSATSLVTDTKLYMDTNTKPY